MKKIIALLMMMSSNAYAQNKYTLQSRPTYDSLGNVYAVKKTYDHIPTATDSADFLTDSDISISKMINENLNPTKTKEKNKKHHLKSNKLPNKKHQ